MKVIDIDIPVIHASAFTKDGKGGNRAGVVLFQEKLTDIEMQNIASRVGYSETAFVTSSTNADYKLRFFTPSGEVDLCGHATIATWSCLYKNGIVQPGGYLQETKAGLLKVNVCQNGQIFMQQKEPFYGEILPKEMAADALNIPTDAINEEFPVQIISTGLRDIIVPINSLSELYECAPNFEKVKELSRKYKSVGIHAFTFETNHCFSIANCRNFAPLYGILEESATGTASGALASYLYKQNVVGKENSQNLIFEQGYSMNEPSEIHVKLEIGINQDVDVMVGGNAAILSESTVDI